MMRALDNFLNRITMYKLVLYVLIAFWGIALVFSFAGLLPYQPMDMIFSAGVILFVSWLTNGIFGAAFEAPTNIESWWISAFILMLIISPISVAASNFYNLLGFLFWASVWAIASKFIFAVGKKHIFNPAAFGVAVTAFAINQSATWWIGSSVLLPFVLIGGFLIVRKIQRWDLVLTFLAVAFGVIVWTGLGRGTGVLTSLQRAAIDSPIFFFAVIMLTEPLTTPPTRKLRMLYGAFVGALFAPAVHIGSIYSTPELALLAGNLVSYAVSPKTKLILKLKEIAQLTPDTYDFVFSPNRGLKFRPGQYLEWTLGHEHADSRGNRRYFTVASSPTEKEIHMGVKFYPNASSFKKTLAEMELGDTIVAGQLAGDFTLPEDASKKLVFIAGGIGVTPYRSMIKYLLDKKQKRNIAMFYSAVNKEQFAYRDLFDRAAKEIGLNVQYVASDTQGFITADLIRQRLPDFLERTFYISGPRSMVVTFQDALKKLGVSREKIKVDFFPGFA